MPRFRSTEEIHGVTIKEVTVGFVLLHVCYWNLCFFFSFGFLLSTIAIFFSRLYYYYFFSFAFTAENQVQPTWYREHIEYVTRNNKSNKLKTVKVAAVKNLIPTITVVLIVLPEWYGFFDFRRTAVFRIAAVVVGGVFWAGRFRRCGDGRSWLYIVVRSHSRTVDHHLSDVKLLRTRKTDRKKKHHENVLEMLCMYTR